MVIFIFLLKSPALIRKDEIDFIITDFQIQILMAVFCYTEYYLRICSRKLINGFLQFLPLIPFQISDTQPEFGILPNPHGFPPDRLRLFKQTSRFMV